MRILRSTVMVRVGGGWVALDEFLVKNDPCRGRSHKMILSQRFMGFNILSHILILMGKGNNDHAESFNTFIINI